MDLPWQLPPPLHAKTLAKWSFPFPLLLVRPPETAPTQTKSLVFPGRSYTSDAAAEVLPTHSLASLASSTPHTRSSVASARSAPSHHSELQTYPPPPYVININSGDGSSP